MCRLFVSYNCIVAKLHVLPKKLITQLITSVSWVFARKIFAIERKRNIFKFRLEQKCDRKNAFNRGILETETDRVYITIDH